MRNKQNDQQRTAVDGVNFSANAIYSITHTHIVPFVMADGCSYCMQFLHQFYINSYGFSGDLLLQRQFQFKGFIFIHSLYLLCITMYTFTHSKRLVSKRKWKSVYVNDFSVFCQLNNVTHMKRILSYTNNNIHTTHAYHSLGWFKRNHINTNSKFSVSAWY